MNENFKVIVKAEYDRLIFEEQSNYYIVVDKKSGWCILDKQGKNVYKSSAPVTLYLP